MPKTPPPPLRQQSKEQENDPPSFKEEAKRGRWFERIKSVELGEIQTKPDWMKGENPLKRVKKFKLGEIQTKPGWMKRKPAKEDASVQDMRWVRIIPFAHNKYNGLEKLPSKLLHETQKVAYCFQKNEKGEIAIYVGCTANVYDKLTCNLHEELTAVDLQDAPTPATYEERFVNRIGRLGGGINEKGKLESVLNALENETYLEITFEERPEHEFKDTLRNKSKPSNKTSGVFFKRVARVVNVINPFDAKTVAAAGGTPVRKKKHHAESAKESRSLSKKAMDAEGKAQQSRIDRLLNENTAYFRVVIKIGAKTSSSFVHIKNEIDRQLNADHRFSFVEGNKPKENDRVPTLWREEELITFVKLPDMADEKMSRKIPAMKEGERTLEDHELTDGVAVGRLIHPVKPPRLVKIPKQQFLRHFFMGGKNGSGKSSTAVQMIQSMLDDWAESPDQAPGFSYVDPAGSTLTIILNRLLHMEQHGAQIPWEKVHYLDLTPESAYPVGLNLLHRAAGEENANVAGDVLTLIKTAYGGDTPRTDRFIENGVMTLLDDKAREHTILGLVSILQYPDLRDTIHVSDPLVQEFWDMDGGDIKAGELGALQNRLRPILQKPAMRRIFGQTRWNLNLLRWMDEGHIVLINVLNLGVENTKLIGGQILNQYHVTAKTRLQDISKPHMLMIDEAHLVQIPVLEKVIAEDRKFGLSLGLITQFPEQFNGLLLKSITENMGTFLTCTLGPSSAAAMSTMMNRAFDAPTLQGLPTSRVAAYTTISKEPFSFMAKSDPPVIYLPNGEAAEYESYERMAAAQQWAIQKSKELAKRDGAHRDEVDREIDEYFAYLRSFRPTDEEEEDNPTRKPTKAKGYKPAKDELPLLELLVEMAQGVSTWEGKTSELLEQLADNAPEEDFPDIGIVAFGKLLGRAKDWLAEKGVQIEKERVRDGTVWRIEVR